MIICDHFSREAFKGLGVCLGATFSGMRHSAHSVPSYAGSKEKNYFFLTFAVRQVGSYERNERYEAYATIILAIHLSYYGHRPVREYARFGLIDTRH